MILWDLKLYSHDYPGYAYLSEYEVSRLPTSVAFVRTSPPEYGATTFARRAECKITTDIYRFCRRGSLLEQSASMIAFPREPFPFPPLLAIPLRFGV